MWRNETLWFNADQIAGITSDWFTDNFWREKGALTGQAKGRGTTYFFSYQNNEYVLRHYRRGGLPGKILTDQFWYTGLSRTRAWRELNLLLQLDELGLPAPRPIAARVERFGFYYRSDIITHRIKDARDIHQFLCQGPLEPHIWEKIGKTIADFHRCQVYHHDLNIHNIMMDADENIWLIDFDKCGFRKSENWKKTNLARLHRSLLKEQQRERTYHFMPENWQSLLNGYHQ